MVIEFERRAHLLDDAVLHHHDLVGHRHGLDLVMRDIDRRGLEPLMQLLDLGPHRDAQFCIEVRQRLVEQKHLRIAHDGAAHRDALALAAGQLARIAFQQLAQVENIGGAINLGFDLGGVRAAQFQREAHIGGHRHVRIERVVLEHHRDVALFRLHVIYDAVADRDRARCNFFQSGEHAQQRRFSTAGGADKHHELAVLDRNRDAMQNFKTAERFTYVVDLHRRHSNPPEMRRWSFAATAFCLMMRVTENFGNAVVP